MMQHHRARGSLVWLRLAALLSVSIAGPGCAAFGDLLGGTSVDAVATSVQKPANVAAYLAVTEDDEPVLELESGNFNVYEDEKLLPSDSIGQRLLAREAVTNERVVVLLDLGAKPSPALIDGMVKGVENFVEKVQSRLPVTVLAYDGSPGLRLVADFPKAPEGSSVSASPLRQLAPKDASRDLHGAVLKGIKELDVRLMQQKKPIRVGTLVVFARGPDLAGRVSEEQIEQALEHKHYNVVGLGVGPETPYFDRLARGGVIHSQAEDTLPVAFEEAAMHVLKTHGKYYLLSYCSPSRAGTRALRIEVKYTNKKGDEKTGNYYFEFDSKGFGPGCKSETPPRFVIPRPENEAAPSPGSAEASSAPNPAEATQGDGTSPSSGEVAPPPDKPGYK